MAFHFLPPFGLFGPLTVAASRVLGFEPDGGDQHAVVGDSVRGTDKALRAGFEVTGPAVGCRFRGVRVTNPALDDLHEHDGTPIGVGIPMASRHGTAYPLVGPFTLRRVPAPLRPELHELFSTSLPHRSRRGGCAARSGEALKVRALRPRSRARWLRRRRRGCSR